MLNERCIRAYQALLAECAASTRCDSQVNKALQDYLGMINVEERLAFATEKDLAKVVNDCLRALASIKAPPAAVEQAAKVSHALKVIGYAAGLNLNYGFKIEHAPLAYDLYSYIVSSASSLDKASPLFTDPELKKHSDDFFPRDELQQILFYIQTLCLQGSDENTLIAVLEKNVLEPRHLRSLGSPAQRGSSLHRPTFDAAADIDFEIRKLTRAREAELRDGPDASLEAEAPKSGVLAWLGGLYDRYCKKPSPPAVTAGDSAHRADASATTSLSPGAAAGGAGTSAPLPVAPATASGTAAKLAPFSLADAVEPRARILGTKGSLQAPTAASKGEEDHDEPDDGSLGSHR